MTYKENFTAKVNEEEGFGKEIILRGERTGRHFTPQPDTQGAGMFKDGERYVMTIEPVAAPKKTVRKKTAAKRTEVTSGGGSNGGEETGSGGDSENES